MTKIVIVDEFFKEQGIVVIDDDEVIIKECERFGILALHINPTDTQTNTILKFYQFCEQHSIQVS